VNGRVFDHLRTLGSEPDLSGTRYRLIHKLGRGGMATVWLAEDPELDRAVAIKVVDLAASPGLEERLLRESQVIARLEHPSIVPVHENGRLPDGRAYYVMKCVRGVRLDEWVRSSPTLTSSLRLFERICEAVAFAHSRGVVHRDLKPQNIMIGEYGEALVMDWGLARDGNEPSQRTDLDATARTNATLAGTVLGTPEYMAPEQARGELERVDARTDVWALGAILYFLLTGRAPHVGHTSEEILGRAREAAIAPPEDRPKALVSMCMKALARAPEDRYASAGELAADAARFLDGERVDAHRETLFEQGARLARRYQTVLWLIAAYLLMRAAVVVFTGR
jgi:eukaryotic-like serine/threonine-protein kinase